MYPFNETSNKSVSGHNVFASSLAWIGFFLKIGTYNDAHFNIVHILEPNQ